MRSESIIKVCGMRDPENIRAVEKLGVQWMGFIFYPRSPRFVKHIPSYLPSEAKRVGVFVNATLEDIKRQAKAFQLDLIQLHGDESVAFCKCLSEMGFHLIKAFALKTAHDTEATRAYAPFCDFFLFDTPSSVYGGTGLTFDWSLLDAYKGKTPFLLSGGLGLEQAQELQKITHPKFVGIDLNSRFESSPGYKDTKQLQSFLTILNYHE